MTKHQLRVQDALKFFAQKDTELGFRKLLDCVADTQQMSLYLKGYRTYRLEGKQS